MSTLRDFEELKVWQKSRLLCRLIYEITGNHPFKRDYSLTDQLRRSAISVMLNIAEGFERDNSKEFIYFLCIAKGSCGEVRSGIYIALDIKYISQDMFNQIFEMTKEIGRLLASLIIYLRGNEISGLRHKRP